MPFVDVNGGAVLLPELVRAAPDATSRQVRVDLVVRVAARSQSLRIQGIEVADDPIKQRQNVLLNGIE